MWDYAKTKLSIAGPLIDNLYRELDTRYRSTLCVVPRSGAAGKSIKNFLNFTFYRIISRICIIF